ncbi:MAG: uroporphyrinogen-III synthase [Chitinophagales bacterium]|nr:uroporphyrinogen-III synthase [Chitinophagales bacterium]MDW8393832.1 uroporphyrinogen-III synthase [Chitinophagales bacterium]
MKEPSEPITGKKRNATTGKKAVNGRQGHSRIQVTSILLTQVRPETDRNPYTELARKHNIHIEFKPFIHLEPLTCRDVRRQRIYPEQHTAVIFTSRSLVDQYFKICDDMRLKLSAECRYYCMTEAIALYLQKYILYRKRKVFYGDGKLETLLHQIDKHHDNDRYLITCADHHRPDIARHFRSKQYEFSEVVLFRTVPAEIKEQELRRHQMLVFFAPIGVEVLQQKVPGFKQRNLLIGAYGAPTVQAAQNAGLEVAVMAPTPELPSMAMALDHFLTQVH